MSQNPYQTPANYGPNYGQSAALASEDARASFIRKTYLHLLERFWRVLQSTQRF